MVDRIAVRRLRTDEHSYQATTFFGSSDKQAIITPGICAGIGSYRLLAEAIAVGTGVNVTILEMPGSGSPVITGTKLDQLVEFTADAIKALDLGKHLTLIGHSRGGSIALCLGALLPSEYVNGVIAINPKTHPLKTDLSVLLPGVRSMGGADLRTTARLAKDLIRSIADADGVTSKITALLHIDEMADIENFLARWPKRLSETAHNRLRSRMGTSLIDMITETGDIELTSLAPYYRRHDIPLQLHLGEKDSITPWQENQAFAKLAGAPYFLYPNVGHLLGSIVLDDFLENVIAAVNYFSETQRRVDLRRPHDAMAFEPGGNRFTSDGGGTIGRGLI